MSIAAIVNGEDVDFRDAIELRDFLSDGARTQFREIWVSVGEASICALCAADQAWLMYLPSSGDPGFSSRNPAYDGDPNALTPFELSNGQRDEYPRQWVLSPDLWIPAIVYFVDSGNRPPTIHWHRDG